MPPSTPAPAFQDGSPDETDRFDAVTGVHDLHDTDPDELADFDTTEPMGPPDSRGSSLMGCDSKPVTALADRIKVLTRGALGYPKLPYLDDLGEPDPFLEAFVQGGGSSCLSTNHGRGDANCGGATTIPDLRQNSLPGPVFEIDLSRDPDGDS